MSTMQISTASTIWRDTLNSGSHQPAVKSGGPAEKEQVEVGVEFRQRMGAGSKGLGAVPAQGGGASMPKHADSRLLWQLAS